MATWGEVKTYVKANFAIQYERANSLGMDFRFEDGRTQMIMLVLSNEVDASGGRWAKLVSPVAKFSAARLSRAADIAGGFHCGGIALATIDGEDWIMLQDSFLLEDVDINEVFEPLHTIVATADLLEKGLTGLDLV